MNVQELFDRCAELAAAEPSATGLRFMHETLVLACGEALRTAGTGFGNLFAQVDYLCKHCGMRVGERVAVQQMRHRSNRTDVPERSVWMQDVRALVLFVSAVFKADVPDGLVRMIPHEPVGAGQSAAVSARYLRCIVSRWDEAEIEAETTDGSRIVIDYSAHGYLTKMLREGMQLNLLDCRVESGRVSPGLVVVEPDFLIDISALAHCFDNRYGHHPLLYTVSRLTPRANTQAILLGNFASAALDDTVNRAAFSLTDTLNQSFREQSLKFCACEDFDAEAFVSEARSQAVNIGEAVELLFSAAEAGGYDRRKALLEPSFVCERLGLQGRVDLMTSDMRLLVEQKSGRNHSIEQAARTQQSPSISYKEDHYVQLLLYYGVLRYNFGKTDSQVDIRLLYSRYPAAQGLLYVNFYRELFREAIQLRNQIVATEMLIAREGFGRILPHLTPDFIYREAPKDSFYERYIKPPVADVARNLSAATPLERAYFERMMTFVYREQLLQKVGRHLGQDRAASNLWNVPLAEKRESGDIILSGSVGGQLNFRRGDMVYLYNYDGDVPDVRRAILYKGKIERIGPDGVQVRLDDEQQGVDVMAQGQWAIEHAGSDQNATSAVKGLYQLLTATADKRALLLGQRSPRCDESLRLSRSYHPDYDDVLLRARQARDYFLLIGPPGTGKTSMALRFLVDEELTVSSSILLTAYTNRAVDEICAMLTEAGHDYLRIGHDTSCDPRFKAHLLENLLGSKPKLSDIRRRIAETPIVVGTTSMLQAHPFIFQLKPFSLCIVDEASQILEPNLIGLLCNRAVGRFILIGDHKQLPAVVQQSEAESRVDEPLLTAIGITDCQVSLFERLLHWEQHEGRSTFVGILRKQGRMHPDIAAFPNELFYHRERLEPVPLAHQLDASLHYDLPSLDDVDEALKQHRVLFMDSGDLERPEHAPDKANPAEARVVADLLRRIHRFYGERFDTSKTVGVIVPYRNQIAMIRQEIDLLGIPDLQDIDIDTVERYQGSQRDVIIYSFTVSRPYQLDFLTGSCFVEDGRVIDRRLNVALTRARKQLLMIGNEKILRQNSIFAQLIERYQRKLY